MTLRMRAAAWLACGLLAVVLLTHPVSVGAQLMLSTTAVVAMMIVWRFGKNAVARQLFLALASLVVIRYLYWRVTTTLPPASDPLGLSLGIVVLAAELYCILILVISLTIAADPLRSFVPRPPCPRSRSWMLRWLIAAVAERWA